METKEVWVIVAILAVSILLGLAVPKYSGNAWKDLKVDYVVDSSYIQTEKSQSMVVNDQMVISNLLKPTDEVKIRLSKVVGKEALFNIWYGSLAQDFKIGLAGKGRIDVNNDGLDDLEMAMPSIPSAGKVLITIKALH